MPVVFNQHFRGTMDYWDPAVTDGLARNREVILFNNAGVSSSSGKVPASFQEMGANAIDFIKALGLSKADVLGFSMGGMIAQEITVQAPGAGSPPHPYRHWAARRGHVNEQIG